jgi:DNA-binding transcriptional LysR family regulator
VRAAAEGLGVVRVADYFAGPLVASGKLRQVLQAYTPPTVPVHALTPPGGLLAPKTRAFLDLVATFFRRSPGAPETGKAGPAAKRTRR